MSTSSVDPYWSNALALWGVLFMCALAPGSVPLGMPGGPEQVVEASRFQPARVTPQEVKERRAKGESFLIVDVRSPESYKAEHIRDAINVPWRDLPSGHAQLPKDRLLLLYCT